MVSKTNWLNGILDRLEWKLKNDSRLDRAVRNNVLRHPPKVDTRNYPILYYEDGEDDYKPLTTRQEQHSIKLRLTVLVKEPDPVRGAKSSKDLTQQVVEVVAGTLEDMRLADAGGVSLARHITAKSRWGQPALDAQGQLIWVGTVLVTITADYNVS